MNDFAKRLGLITLAAILLVTAAWGQVNISPGSTITENFTIGTSATATLPAGWKADKNTTVRLVGSYSAAVTATERAGGDNLSTTAGNGIYNYAAGDPAKATDRAVGGLSSSSASKSVNVYVQLTNNGESTIDALNISYEVEKYRRGSNAAGFSIQMYYSTDGSSWTSAGGDFLTSFSADADNSGYASAPGATESISNKTLSQSILPSGSLYLAWNYSVTSGSTTSNAQALGIDDVSIKALSSEPTTQASSLSFTEVGETGMTISWTSGNGSNRIVIVKAGSAVDGEPVDGTSYTANTTFGSGTQIGTGNYVVYNGTGSSVAITGLTDATTYHVAIAEFNGSGGTENYLTDSPLTGNQATLAGEGPANPEVVMSGRTATSITFTWTKNGSGDDVMLFYNTVNEIGTPVDGVSYSVSEEIPDGGTVLYNGGGQTSYTHSSLTPNTTYYYAIHSVDESVIYSSGITGPCETLKAEPSNHVSNFIASSVGKTSLIFTWSDNDGTYAADSFVVALETTADYAPTDGSDATDGINPGEQLKYVDHGVQTVTFTGLNEDTEYTARIWPVSNTNRATTDWDYKTGGSVPQVIQTTRRTPTLPFAENFDYTENDLLVNVGWTAHSGEGTNSVRVVSPGLEFSGYPGSGIGNAVALDNTGEDVNLVFDAVTSGTVYVSFLMKTSATNYAGYFLHLGQTNIGTTFFSRVWVNATGDGVGIGSSAPSEYIPITPGTPTLIVLKLNYDTKLSELFVFNSMPSSEPATPDASFTETATFTNVGSVALRQYNASQNIIVDGIRVATSWNDAPLPITLASFSAEAANGKVNVTWVTESETENAAFRIYRDGEMIAELEGAGTTTEPQNYSFTDQYVIPGRTYSYVLADVDYQGKETKHPRVEVEAEYVDQVYTIGAAYPNPFNPVTLVPLNLAKDAVVTATLYDITGRPLRELQNGSLSAGSHDLRIDGTNLSTGIYFVRVRVNDATHVQKIALMK